MYNNNNNNTSTTINITTAIVDFAVFLVRTDG